MAKAKSSWLVSEVEENLLERSVRREMEVLSNKLDQLVGVLALSGHLEEKTTYKFSCSSKTLSLSSSMTQPCMCMATKKLGNAPSRTQAKLPVV